MPFHNAYISVRKYDCNRDIRDTVDHSYELQELQKHAVRVFTGVEEYSSEARSKNPKKAL